MLNYVRLFLAPSLHSSCRLEKSEILLLPINLFSVDTILQVIVLNITLLITFLKTYLNLLSIASSNSFEEETGIKIYEYSEIFE